jgi:hypothetical protein
VLLLSLPSYGQRRWGGRQSANFPLGWAILELGSKITGGSSDFTPALPSHGVLSLKVPAKEAEMYIDDRFIGLAGDFKGQAVISVPSGEHVVEFRYNGLTYKTNAHIIRARTTSLTYTFKTNDSP